MQQRESPDSHNFNHIVVMIPHNFSPNVRDTRLHLLFVSIVALAPNYHLYLVGLDREIISILALLYMYPSHFTELDNIRYILDAPHIHKVLRLELGMFINNPYTIRNSPAYMPKEYLLAGPRSVPQAEALIPSDIGVLHMSSSLVSDIYMHLCDRNISLITQGREITISCVLVVDTLNHQNLIRSLECYHNQTHIRKELIIVASSNLSELIVKHVEGITSHILWVEDCSLPIMWNIGIKACTGDYVLRWNLSDWYHPTILSIFADRTNTHDYISLPRIIELKSDNHFVISDQRFKGWEPILMIRRDKFTAIPDIKEWKAIYMDVQWNCCDSVYIFELGYEVLYVHNLQEDRLNDTNYHVSKENNLSPALCQYYEAIFLRPEAKNMPSVFDRLKTYTNLGSR